MSYPHTSGVGSPFASIPVPGAGVYPQPQVPSTQFGGSPSYGASTFSYTSTTSTGIYPQATGAYSAGPAPAYTSPYPAYSPSSAPATNWTAIFGENNRVQEIKQELTDLTREIFDRYYDASPRMKTYYRSQPKQYKVPSAQVFNFDFSNKSTNIGSFNNVNSNNSSYSSYGTGSSYGRSQKKDDDNSTRVLVGIIAVVVGAVTAFFLGRDIQKYKIASRGEELLHELELARAGVKSHGIQDKQADTIIASGRKFFSKINTNVKWSIATKAALVAACVAALIGAFVFPPLMFAGLALGGLSIMAIALNWGLQCGDDKYMSRLAEQIIFAPAA